MPLRLQMKREVGGSDAAVPSGSGMPRAVGVGERGAAEPWTEGSCCLSIMLCRQLCAPGAGPSHLPSLPLPLSQKAGHPGQA